MFRFKKVGDNLYRYRDVDVLIQFDDDGNSSMLAKIVEASGESTQFYSYGIDFERVKQTMIEKIDMYIEGDSDSDLQETSSDDN